MNKRVMTLVLITLVSVLMSVASASAADIVLRWHSANHAEPQIMPIRERLIKEFEAANPGIKIEQVVGPRADHWTMFVTAAQAGRTPDLYDTGLAQVATAAYEGWIYPMDEFVIEADLEQMLPSILETGKSEGQIVGWPFWSGAYAMFYNTEMLQEAGLDANNLPKTWDEYLEWAKILTRDTNNDGIIDQYGFADVFGRTDTNWRHHLIWLWSNGGDMLNQDMTKCLLDQPEAIEALKFRTELYTEHGVVPPGPTSYEYVEQTNAFAFEKVASILTAQWAIAKMHEDNPEIKGKYITGPIPYKTQGATFSLPQYFTIGRDSKHPEAAWKFIQFMCSKENVVQRSIDAMWLPLRKDVLTDPRIQGHPELGPFADLMNEARAYPAHPKVTEMIDIGIAMTHEVLTGRKTPEEAAASATAEIDALLK